MGRRLTASPPVPPVRRRIARLLLPLLLVAGAAAAPDLAGLRYDQRIGAALPLDARFRDETGQPVSLGQVTGGVPTVLVLGYFHCPALCGIVRADAMTALARAGLSTPAQYRLVAISIDPAETPADAARAKAGDLARFPNPGADAGWRFLTGAAPAIGRVSAALGFQGRYDPGLKQFLHPTGIVFATGAGRISSYLLGLGYAPADLRAGVARARAGGFAHAPVAVLLLCFHFDPATGRYTLAVTRLLRLASAMFVATLGAVLLRSWARG